MTLMKQKSKTDILEDIQNSLKKVYVQKQFGEYTFFINKNGTIFNVEDFPGRNAVVTVYADDEYWAKINVTEDGDCFYPEDYETSEELFAALRKEIDAE